MSVDLRPFTPADAAWLVAAHAELYADEAGFDAGFGALVGEIVAAFLRDHDPACDRGWIAWQGDARLGSIFCVRAAPGIARLRLFLLLPEARGQGLGRRMLDTCLGFARATGYARLILDTHESHLAACALYRRAGFTCLSSRPVHSFGQDLVQQRFEIAL